MDSETRGEKNQSHMENQNQTKQNAYPGVLGCYCRYKKNLGNMYHSMNKMET